MEKKATKGEMHRRKRADEGWGCLGPKSGAHFPQFRMNPRGNPRGRYVMEQGKALSGIGTRQHRDVSQYIG
jgi:hypothetical protein